MRRIAERDRPGPLHVPAPAELLDVLREGPMPLAAAPAEGTAESSLTVAFVLPQFRRGSGGHGTIAHVVRGLEARGHHCSLWVRDDEGRHADESEPEVGAIFRRFFGPVDAPVHSGLDGWAGADVVVATGWQTVPTVLRLPRARGRAYLVQDHEPEFYGTSAEKEWARWTYRQGLHCIAASPWLAALLRDRYQASASSFDLAVDHAVYRPIDASRREDTVLFYARSVTARRAVPLGVLALEELHRRRPRTRIALFGEAREITTRFPYQQLGVLSPQGLAEAYSSSTVGLVLSLTNPSLIPQEMMACGLPCVDVASDAMLASYGAQGPISLAAQDPLALADALEGLLAQPALGAQRSTAGIAWTDQRTWAGAAAQVEAGLLDALRPEAQRRSR